MVGLADFAGHWRLERQIADARAGLEGVFSGQAGWVPESAGLRQEERGVLIYGTAAPMKAERCYLWSEAEGRLIVRFDDGRPFHEFSPDAPEADHLCGEDFYQVAYDFSAWPQWNSRWRVTGPRKDLVLTSRFAPMDQAK